MTIKNAVNNTVNKNNKGSKNPVSVTDGALKMKNLKEQIAGLCTQLRLPGLKARFEEASEDPRWKQLTVEEQIRDLLECEKTRRYCNAVLKLKRDSNIPEELAHSKFSNLIESPEREIDKRLLRLVSLGEWMTREEPANLIVSGACGVGKSFIAACCCNMAIELKKPVYFVRAGRLFEDLAIKRVDGSLEERKAWLKKKWLLVLDDFLIEPMKKDSCSDLLDLLNDRAGTSPLIFTSQYKFEGWLDAMGNTPVTQAIMDRLRKSAYRLHIGGPSMRKTMPSP